MTIFASCFSYFLKSVTMSLRVTHHARCAGQQSRVRRLVDGHRVPRRCRCDRSRADAPPTATTPASSGPAIAAAEDGHAQQYGAQHRRGRSADHQLLHTLPADPQPPLRCRPCSDARVVEDFPRVRLVDLGHVGMQPERPVVGVQAELAERWQRQHASRRSGATSMVSRVSNGPIEVVIRPPTSSPSQAPTSPISTISTATLVRGQRRHGHHDRAWMLRRGRRRRRPAAPKAVVSMCLPDTIGRDVAKRRIGGQDRGVLDMSAAEFDDVVGEALDGVPPELTRLMDNVAVFVEDEPPPDDPDLLGWYDGTPLTERGWSYAGVLPDRIVVFRLPLLRMCREPRRAGRRGARHGRPRDRPPLRHRRRPVARARLRLSSGDSPGCLSRGRGRCRAAG